MARSSSPLMLLFPLGARASLATATFTATGFLIPALRINPLTPFPGLVALNNPVLLIRGNRPSKLVSVTSKPKSNRTSASSNTKTSNSETSRSSNRPKISSRRPGVATTMSLPREAKRRRSSSTGLPPTSSSGSDNPHRAHNCWATWYVCRANSLVGLMTNAPTSLLLSRLSRLKIISTHGIKNANVLPLPVTATAHTSLLVRKRGMTADCTGVMEIKFIEDANVSIPGERAGRTDSNELGGGRGGEGVIGAVGFKAEGTRAIDADGTSSFSGAEDTGGAACWALVPPLLLGRLRFLPAFWATSSDGTSFEVAATSKRS
mmetsp:Transcript_4951/g.14157  ORF Transcript_4951/g.14157 Transcript_4951/m.14157 type:complete len:319 (-) Transcript_4951:240-1196(-)